MNDHGGRSHAVPGYKPGSGDDAMDDGESTTKEPAGCSDGRDKTPEFFELILSEMSDTVVLTTESGKLTYVCPNVQVIFGYSRHEVAALGNISDLLGVGFKVPTDLEIGESVEGLETEITDKSGSLHALLVSIKRVTLDGGSFLVVCRDITRRKTAENELRVSHVDMEDRVQKRTEDLQALNRALRTEIAHRKAVEEELRSLSKAMEALLNATTDAAFLLDSESRYLTLNDACAARHDMEKDALIGQSPFDLFPADVSEPRKRKITEVFQTGRAARFRDERDNMVLDNSVVPVFDDEGAVDAVAVFSRDITELVRTIEAVREGEHRLQLALSGAEVGMWDWDLTTGAAIWSESLVQRFGYSQGEVPQDIKSWKAHVHPDDWPAVAEALNRHLSGEVPQYKATYRLAHKSGQYSWVHALGRISQYDDDGKPMRMAGIIRDVTEQKMAEDALRRSEREKTAILQAIGEMVALQDREGRVIWANRTAAESVGNTLSDLEGRHCFEIWHGLEHRCPGCPIESTFETGVMNEGEITSPDGRSWRLRGYPVTDEAGHVIGVVEVGRDITVERKMLVAIKESEQRFRVLFEQAADSIFVHDLGGTILDANAAACASLGYNKEELLTKHVHDIDLSVEAPASQEDLWNRLPVTFESMQVRKDGCTFPVEVRLSPIQIAGRPLILGVARDITERKQAENEIASALREKELLLREIHHRVKNNLAVVSSLLSLQGHYMSSGFPTGVLDEIRNRIRSMALAHELLYQSENLSQLNAVEYLGNLTDHLFATYAGVGGNVRLEKEIGPIRLNLDSVIPLGLLVTELVSNSMKHAFHGISDGKVRVSFNKTDDGRLELIVNDNGIGIPDTVDFTKPASMGLELVSTFVENLDGELEVRKEHGTHIRIRFKELI
jgi:PAS domain S-box-containing protein